MFIIFICIIFKKILYIFVYDKLAFQNMKFSEEKRSKFKLFHLLILETLTHFRKLHFYDKTAFGMTNKTKKMLFGRNL